MILAATDWLTISINLLLVIFVVVCLLMSVMILMQRPKQEGLGAAFGSGMTDQMFGSQTTTVLQRGTVWFATLFFVLALALAVLIGMRNTREESLVEAEQDEETTVVTEVVEDVEDAVDDAQDTIRSLADELSPGDEDAGGTSDEAANEDGAGLDADGEESTVDESGAAEENSDDDRR